MASKDDEILRQLENISFLMGDLNSIRNGEYDPPRGADPQSTVVRATPDDIYSRLGTMIALMERQNIMIYNIGLNMVDNEDHWHRQNEF